MKGPLSPEWPLQGLVGWGPVWDARGLGQPCGDVLRPLADTGKGFWGMHGKGGAADPHGGGRGILSTWEWHLCG